MIAKHLFRYFIASYLLKKSKDEIKLASKFMKEISSNYKDEFIEFAQVLTQTFEYGNLPRIFKSIYKVKAYKLT